MSSEQKTKPRLTPFQIFLLVPCLILFAARVVLFWDGVEEKHLGDDYNHYYGGAFLLSQGLNPYKIKLKDYDFKYNFNWQEKVPSPTNPPLLTTLTLPLAYLSPLKGWYLWQATTLLLSTGLIYLVFWRIFSNWSLGERLIGAGMFFSSRAYFANASLSQAQIILYFFLALGLYSLLKGRNSIAYLCLGLTAALKIFTWPLLLFPWLLGDRIGTLKCIIISFVLFISPAIFGLDFLLGFFENALPTIKASGIAFGHNVSWGKLMYNSAQAISEKHSTLISHLCFFIMPLGIILSFLISLHLRGGEFMKTRLRIAFSTIAVLSTVFSPVCWENYYLVLVFLLPSLWNKLRDWPRRQRGISFCLLFIAWIGLFQRPHSLPLLGKSPIGEIYSAYFYNWGSLLVFLLILSSIYFCLSKKQKLA